MRACGGVLRGSTDGLPFLQAASITRLGCGFLSIAVAGDGREGEPALYLRLQAVGCRPLSLARRCWGGASCKPVREQISALFPNLYGAGHAVFYHSDDDWLRCRRHAVAERAVL